MRKWLSDNSKTGFYRVRACMRNYSLGGFQAPKHVRRETEEGEEEHGGSKREWELGDTLKETKALSFWGPFCYCRPLCARLLGLLHNAGPLWAAHHWLSCHFKLASFLRTAAPEAWTHLSWKKWSGHTHTHTHFAQSELIRRWWAKWEHRENLRPSELWLEITVTLFQPRLSPLSLTHACTHWHFCDTHS